MSSYLDESRTQPGAGGRRAARKGPKPITDEKTLYEYAVGALGRRMRTAAELKRLLRKRVVDAESGAPLISAVIARLTANRYLSDERYAAEYSSLRRSGRGVGSRRVAQDLLHKGVHPDIVAREVEAAYADTDEETQARLFLKRKRIEKPEPRDDRAKARLFRLMARAGFGPGVTMKILRSWDPATEE